MVLGSKEGAEAQGSDGTLGSPRPDPSLLIWKLHPHGFQVTKPVEVSSSAWNLSWVQLQKSATALMLGPRCACPLPPFSSLTPWPAPWCGVSILCFSDRLSEQKPSAPYPYPLVCMLHLSIHQLRAYHSSCLSKFARARVLFVPPASLLSRAVREQMQGFLLHPHLADL